MVVVCTENFLRIDHGEGIAPQQIVANATGWGYAGNG